MAVDAARLELSGGGEFNALIDKQVKGFSLQQEFYQDPAIFERDISRIHLRRWFCVGHVSRIPNRGDYFVFDVANESFIIVRDRDDEIHALANVCRHRGSQVCYEKEGSSKVFVCPYHGWSYNLDGSLRAGRLFESDLDKSLYGLKRLHVRIIQGAILVCCADDPPDLSEAEQVLGTALGYYDWANAKVAHRACYSVDANWKLATENYLECYHCDPAHPEFARIHSTGTAFVERRELRSKAHRRASLMGVSIPEMFSWPASASNGEGVSCYEDSFLEGFVTGSEDGKAVAPLMGDFTDYDGGFTYAEVGPSSYFLAYPDHGVMYLFVPKDTQKTDMEIVWLVRDDAREGEDYDFSRLIWMWDVTSIADKRIIDHNQKGVNSNFYRPGPYHPMEEQLISFVEWYLKEIRDRV
jgi:Rieske 2Fe-2S family protein